MLIYETCMPVSRPLRNKAALLKRCFKMLVTPSVQTSLPLSLSLLPFRPSPFVDTVSLSAAGRICLYKGDGA